MRLTQLRRIDTPANAMTVPGRHISRSAPAVERFCQPKLPVWDDRVEQRRQSFGFFISQLKCDETGLPCFFPHKKHCQRFGRA